MQEFEGLSGPKVMNEVFLVSFFFPFVLVSSEGIFRSLQMSFKPSKAN